MWPIIFGCISPHFLYEMDGYNRDFMKPNKVKVILLTKDMLSFLGNWIKSS